MKKLFATVLIMLITITALTIAASARTPAPGLTEAQVDVINFIEVDWSECRISQRAIDAITPEQLAELAPITAQAEASYANFCFESAMEEYLASPAFAELATEFSIEAAEIISQANATTNATTNITPANIITPNSAPLSRFFSLRDGISATAIDRMLGIHLIDAGTGSTLWHPIDAMRRDAARHFIWNFRGVQDSSVGYNATRVFTINHEYATLLLGARQARYNTLRNQGQTSAQAANSA